MNSFQSQVLNVSWVILVISLSLMGLMIYLTYKKIHIPPETAGCPDYWEVSDDGKCEDTKNLSLGMGCSPKDFNENKYRGVAGQKAKCLWAKDCNVEWDGITNAGIC